VNVFGQGDFGQRIVKPGSDEIGKLAETFNRMAQGLQANAALEQQVSVQADELRPLSEERGRLLEKTISA
jgi:nitrate/nitrite-specific signal transduction histidine kinase